MRKASGRDHKAHYLSLDEMDASPKCRPATEYCKARGCRAEVGWDPNQLQQREERRTLGTKHHGARNNGQHASAVDLRRCMASQAHVGTDAD